jgi:hypothetical protein
VLLAPELEQRFGEPAAVGEQSVDAGVAGRAEGHQKVRLVPAGPAVMHVEGFPGPTRAAGVIVALEHGFAVPAKTAAGMGGPAGTGPALAGSGREGAAAGAEQAALAGAGAKGSAARQRGGPGHEVG